MGHCKNELRPFKKCIEATMIYIACLNGKRTFLSNSNSKFVLIFYVGYLFGRRKWVFAYSFKLFAVYIRLETLG